MQILFTLPAALVFALLTAAPATELLIVLPLDTAVVSVDSGASAAALADEKTSRRNLPSPAALVAKTFHPAFGDAVAHAARGVEVIDSSAATDSLSRAAAASGFARVRDPDSSRYALALRALKFSQTSRTVARRTVPPSPVGFDPATGLLTPGVRRAYSEGPGRMITLTATAAWEVRDHAEGSLLAAGEAKGSAEFRGEPRRADWDKAARELALDVLRQTPFAPPLPAAEGPGP